MPSGLCACLLVPLQTSGRATGWSKYPRHACFCLGILYDPSTLHMARASRPLAGGAEGTHLWFYIPVYDPAAVQIQQSAEVGVQHLLYNGALGHAPALPLHSIKQVALSGNQHVRGRKQHAGFKLGLVCEGHFSGRSPPEGRSPSDLHCSCLLLAMPCLALTPSAYSMMR